LLIFYVDMTFTFDSINEIRRDFNWHSNVAIGNYEQRPELLGKLWSFQHSYLLVADIIHELFLEYQEQNPKFEPLWILYYNIQSTIYECNILQINFLFGGYAGAARTARWILETSIGTAGAILDASILKSDHKSKSMTIREFISCLEKYDRQGKMIPRKNILPLLNISKLRRKQIDCLYSKLSKQSHLSETTFTRPHSDPNFHSQLSMNPQLFKKTLELTLQVIDVSMYSNFYSLISVSGIDEDLKSNLHGLINSYFQPKRNRTRQKSGLLLPKDIPMTWRLLSQYLK